MNHDQFNTTKAVTKDEGIQVYSLEKDRFSCGVTTKKQL